MPRGRKKKSVLSDINAPAVQFAPEDKPAPSPPSDPVLSAILALGNKIDTFEGRLTAIEQNRSQPQEQTVDDTIDRPIVPSKKVYNNPRAASVETDAPSAAAQITFVPVSNPTKVVKRQSIVTQNVNPDKRVQVDHSRIASLEAEADAFLQSAGLVSIKTRPITSADRATDRKKRIIVTCSRCHKECGKDTEWITTDDLRSDGSFICNSCIISQ